MVPTPPSEPFSSHESRFVVFFGLTRIPQISQVLLLMVGNLTEVGGHFRLTRIPLFGWGLAHTGSTDLTGFAFDGGKSHGGWWAF